MPFTDVGVSFNPARPAGDGGPPKNPVQEAVQTLNVRLPKIFGARPPSPAALLTGAGGMGQWGRGGNLVAQVLAMLAGLPVHGAQMQPLAGARRQPSYAAPAQTDWSSNDPENPNYQPVTTTAVQTQSQPASAPPSGPMPTPKIDYNVSPTPIDDWQPPYQQL